MGSSLQTLEMVRGKAERYIFESFMKGHYRQTQGMHEKQAFWWTVKEKR